MIQMAVKKCNGWLNHKLQQSTCYIERHSKFFTVFHIENNLSLCTAKKSMKRAVNYSHQKIIIPV